MNSDLIELLRLLVDHGVRFLVVGGFAVIHYAEPRYTKDIDLWVATDPTNAERVRSALIEFGAPVSTAEADFFTSEESFIMIGFPPNKADILMSIPGIPFEAAWARRETITFGTLSVPIIGLDDLIIAKRAIGRSQDLIDVESLLVAKRLREPGG